MEKVEVISYGIKGNFSHWNQDCYCIKNWSDNMIDELIVDYITEDEFIIGRLISKYRYLAIDDNLQEYDIDYDEDWDIRCSISNRCYFLKEEELISELL